MSSAPGSCSLSARRLVHSTCPQLTSCRALVVTTMRSGRQLKACSATKDAARDDWAAARQVAFLPPSLGGLGLLAAERVSPAAYWAAWADALPVLCQRYPDAAARLVQELEGEPAAPCLGEVVVPVRSPQPCRPSAPQCRAVRGKGSRRRRLMATCIRSGCKGGRCVRQATYQRADRTESGGGRERPEPRLEVTRVLERKCEVRERRVAANLGFLGRVRPQRPARRRRVRKTPTPVCLSLRRELARSLRSTHGPAAQAWFRR